MTINIKLMETLIAQAEASAYRRGQEEATCLPLDESSYGATRSDLIVLRSDSFLKVRQMIRGHRWRRYGDNPGQAYMGTCTPIHIRRGDNCLEAICIVSTCYDI